jgi:hypothetical protein
MIRAIASTKPFDPATLNEYVASFKIRKAS